MSHRGSIARTGFASRGPVSRDVRCAASLAAGEAGARRTRMERTYAALAPANFSRAVLERSNALAVVARESAAATA